MLTQLTPQEYNPYYGNYIRKAGYLNIVEGLRLDQKAFVEFVQRIPVDKWKYAYADGKWTIAEVLQHIIDTERIFSYRALCFARKDQTPLAGFEQDDYVPNSNANHYSKEQVLVDFVAMRNNTISLFTSFSEEMLRSTGVAGGSPMSARAAGYIICGHQRHHLEVMKERYL